MDKANVLNQYFASVLTKENNKNIEKLRTKLIASKTNISIEVVAVVEYKLFCQTDPTKASGPDGIPGRLLKEGDMQLAEPLTRVFNMSLQSRSLLMIGRKLTTPNHKKGDKHKPSNYTPTSLTSLCAHGVITLLYFLCSSARGNKHTHIRSD